MPNEKKYIDAEKLNALLDDLCVTDGIYDAIQSLPAADVAEVKRGHWIEDGSVQICSECGEEHEWGEYRATYCEDCGARMDGTDSG